MKRREKKKIGNRNYTHTHNLQISRKRESKAQRKTARMDETIKNIMT